MTTAKDNLIAGRPLIRLGNVVTPTVTLYKAKGAGSAPGPAIVVFPGAAITFWPSILKARKCAIG